MARRTVVTVVSDLSGKPIDGDGVTLEFGLDGATYEIDLSTAEQEALRKVLAPYIEASRKVSKALRAQANARIDVASAKEIRAWALENGHEVPPRGRIPAAAAEAYLVAHRAPQRPQRAPRG